MKISFSTLGCPEWSWEDMLVTAKDLGFDGIEIRGIENELYVPKAKPFKGESIDATLKRLNKLNIEIPCLTSSCYLFDKNQKGFYMAEGKDYIELAQRIGTPYVRVLGDSSPEPGKDIDLGFVADSVTELADYAKDRNVTLLVETNGIFANSEEMLKLMKQVNRPQVAVLWDIHHPYRYYGEPVEKTYEALGEYIKFIHIKDSVVENSRIRYKMTGHGDIPVKPALTILKDRGYEGFVSLEWVKRWCIDLEDPGVVFSQYVNFVKHIV